MWDFSSPTRDRTWGPTVKAPSPKHWTAREVLKLLLKKSIYKKEKGLWVRFLIS